MNQVLHISRKDIRHLWIEILLSWAALAFLGRTNWLHCSPHRDFRWIYEAQTLAVLLVVFTWWILTVRVVQDESLVGDRQFWVSRPYEWKKLLVAKVLFVVAVIHIPAVLLYIFLLRLAGYALLPRSGEILEITSTTSLMLLLPIAALAVLTRKLSQALLILIGGILASIAIAGFGSYYFHSAPSISSGSVFEDLPLIAFVLLACAAIVFQYARRRLLRAWLFMILAFAAIPLLGLVIPYRMLTDREFPLVNTKPLQITFDATRKTKISPPPNEKRELVTIPVDVSGVPNNTIDVLRGAIVFIDSPDGRQWRSDWESQGNDIYPDTANTTLALWIDKSVYDHVKSAPVHVRVLLAISELHEVQRHEVIAQETFTLPNVGLCWLTNRSSAGSFASIECRSNGGGPKNILMTLSPSGSTCPTNIRGTSDPNSPTMRMLNREVGGYNPLVPLTTRMFYFSMWSSGNEQKPELPPQVCPGTALAFSNYDRFRSTRVEYDLGNIRLADYHQQSLNYGSGAIGISVP